jgi:hypothetical protein
MQQPDLGQLIQEMGPTTTGPQAEALLERTDMEEVHLLAVLRKRALAAAVIEAIARRERWMERQAIKVAIVSHPKTPRTLALRQLSWLFWGHLLKVTNNPQVAMPIRIAAERLLRERLLDLEPGERTTLARSAPPGLIKPLLEDEDPRVIGSLLQNPFLPEVEVLTLVESEKTAPEVLRLVAESSRWGSRYQVLLGLVKNRRTPTHSALRILASLPRPLVAEIIARHPLPRLLQLGAERILAGQNLGRRRPR